MLDNIIIKYQTLTGKTIPDNLIPQYEAWGNRAIIELQSKLGWSFSGVSNVKVLGCSPSGCDCDIDVSKLTEAPEKKGEYRFYSFDDKQPYVMVDPFKKVNAVYLCRVEPEGRNISTNDGEVVILKKIDKFAPRYFNADFGKYIEACKEMTYCQQFCQQSCTKCTALLVDGDWVKEEDLPDSIWYLICDYIDWIADGGLQNRGISREEVDGHSVSYRRDVYIYGPYTTPAEAELIALFTGPYGMLDRKRIW